jgi:uncharacterized protein (DUF2141 family)
MKLTMAKLISTLLIASISYCSYAQTGTVIFNVQGIQVSKGGEISAGIFKKEYFPKVGQQFIGKEIAISAEQMQVIFESVPIGTYAMVVFQDIDKDKKLKSNVVGFPKEPIGFSRDAKIKLGPPDFDDAKVELQQGKKLIITIILR